MEQFNQPPPIEDLSDLQWRRLEDQVLALAGDQLAQAVPPASRGSQVFGRRTVAAMAVCMVAAAALAFILLRSPDPQTVVSARTRLVSEAASTLLTIGDANLVAGPHSAMVVTHDDKGGVRLVLEMGTVHCSVAPRLKRPPFVVESGEVVVTVLGTEFSVERRGDSAQVTVIHGRVGVLEAGKRFVVSAGESWPNQTAALDPSLSAPVAKEPSDDLEQAEQPKVKEPVARPRQADDTTATAPPKQSAKERYAAAAKLESTDPKAAVTIYRSLARGRGPWVANALFAQGRLEVELGRRRAAKTSLNRYLKKFPRGLNAEDARLLLGKLGR